uniref:Uncharacterized protein n=1 Tax=Acrobeloides nanus TaxID=290746 RepID=A0A914DJ05_9BILA
MIKHISRSKFPPKAHDDMPTLSTFMDTSTTNSNPMNKVLPSPPTIVSPALLPDNSSTPTDKCSTNDSTTKTPPMTLLQHAQAITIKPSRHHPKFSQVSSHASHQSSLDYHKVHLNTNLLEKVLLSK